MLVIQDYNNEHKYEGVMSVAYSLVAACFMSMMYSCLLHTLSDMHSFNKYIMIIAVAAVIEMQAAYFISFRIKNIIGLLKSKKQIMKMYRSMLQDIK